MVKEYEGELKKVRETAEKSADILGYPIEEIYKGIGYNPRLLNAENYTEIVKEIEKYTKKQLGKQHEYEIYAGGLRHLFREPTDSVDDSLNDFIPVNYYITEEGVAVLPEELKERIKEDTRDVIIKSDVEAFPFIVDIGMDKLMEYAEESKVSFPEIVALSNLYAEKVSGEGLYKPKKTKRKLLFRGK